MCIRRRSATYFHQSHTEQRAPMSLLVKSLLLMAYLGVLLHSIILRNGMVDASEFPKEIVTQRRFEFLDVFLDSYRQTVDTIVDIQTSYWNFIPRYNSIDESKIDGMCDSLNNAHIGSSIPKYLREKRQLIGKTNTEDKKTTASTLAGNSTLLNGFQYDKETDIDRYLTELGQACSQDVGYSQFGANRYQKECLDVLRSIVYEPRCTTRFDSRVKCNGDHTIPHSSKNFVSAQDIIKEHFEPESLNVVIVGAGPVGLMLANALSILPQRQRQRAIPPIRILMLESRADAPGLKKGYSRNWQAHLNLLHFRNLIDPRVTKIFASMTDDKDYPEDSIDEFVLPVNAIETLLLLSNRDMGATKFLFGTDPLEFVDDLKDVPNLILVDGTGHRLEPLRRGTVCDGIGESEGEDCDTQNSSVPETVIYNYRSPRTPEVTWLNEENIAFYDELGSFNVDFTEKHDFLAEHGHGLHVAQFGDLMYPIDEKTGAPKTIYWLDVHGATRAEEQSLEDREEENENLYANNGGFCDWCKNWYNKKIDEGYRVEYQGEFNFYFDNEKDDMIDERCEMMCFTDYFASSTVLLRDDIHHSIIAGRFDTNTFVYQSDGWFPLMGYSFNPSTELAHQIEKVLESNGFKHDPVGMPLRDLYPALEGSMDTTRLAAADLDLVKALKRISLHFSNSNWPAVTLFTQSPFIYTNGIKDEKACKKKASDLADNLEDVPMIRIGDSFTTGDGLNGGGFYTHATMIGIFMDIILHKTMVQ